MVCDSNADFSRIFWQGTVDDFELRFSYKLGHFDFA